MPQSEHTLTPLPHSAQNRCFGCGQANPHGLHLEFLLAADGAVVCLPTISSDYEGPPQCVHGGIIATMLDEAMSKAVRARGLVAMTRKMEVDYLRPVPTGVSLRLESRVTGSEGRAHRTEARILSPEGVTLAEAKGLFIEVKPRQPVPGARAADPAS